jgi:hypothetical protein
MTWHPLNRHDNFPLAAVLLSLQGAIPSWQQVCAFTMLLHFWCCPPRSNHAQGLSTRHSPGHLVMRCAGQGPGGGGGPGARGSGAGPEGACQGLLLPCLCSLRPSPPSHAQVRPPTLHTRVVGLTTNMAYALHSARTSCTPLVSNWSWGVVACRAPLMIERRPACTLASCHVLQWRHPPDPAAERGPGRYLCSASFALERHIRLSCNIVLGCSCKGWSNMFSFAVDVHHSRSHDAIHHGALPLPLPSLCCTESYHTPAASMAPAARLSPPAVSFPYRHIFTAL